jgi:hypothetical protein
VRSSVATRSRPLMVIAEGQRRAHSNWSPGGGGNRRAGGYAFAASALALSAITKLPVLEVPGRAASWGSQWPRAVSSRPAKAKKGFARTTPPLPLASAVTARSSSAATQAATASLRIYAGRTLTVVLFGETLDFQPNPGDRAQGAVGISAQRLEGFWFRVGQHRVECLQKVVEGLRDTVPKRPIEPAPIVRYMLTHQSSPGEIARQPGDADEFVTVPATLPRHGILDKEWGLGRRELCPSQSYCSCFRTPE